MSRDGNRVAIVTGGGQGCGYGIAMALAKDGLSMVISGRHMDKLKRAASEIEALGVKVLPVVADVRYRAAADETVAAAIRQFGRLDVLVNNAMIVEPGVAFEDATDENIENAVESGLYGTIYHMQAAFPHMKERGGSIINLGSREGIYGGLGMHAYAATKEGVRAISRVTAREWGRYNIRVNVICPAAMSPSAQAYLDANPVQAEMYRAAIPLGRFGDLVNDIGPVAAFLAGEQSRYVTGQTINVDGGQIML